jgi:uncharacterized repeat protein (TIGR01451 family)
MLNRSHGSSIIRLAAASLVLWMTFAPAFPASARTTKAQGAASAVDASPISPSAAVVFVPNVGQAGADVAYQTTGSAGRVLFSPEGVTIVPNAPGQAPIAPGMAELQARQQGQALAAPDLADAPPAFLRIRFDGANPTPAITGKDRLAAEYHYYSGNDPSQWRTHVPTYAGIVYQQLYDGIDLEYNSGKGYLKGTYMVAPGQDAKRIRWHYDGADRVTLDAASGALRIVIPVLDRSQAEAAGIAAEMIATRVITEEAPLAWQEIDGQRRPVEVRYSVQDDGKATASLGFDVGQYDPAYALIIDPTLLYSGYLAYFTKTYGNDITTDAQGNVYVVGMTATPYFYYPITPPFGMAGDAECYFTTYCHQAYILKLDRNGGLIYVVEFGGTYQDKINAISVDSTGGAVVVGDTFSLNLPTPNGLHTSPATTNCYQQYISVPYYLHGSFVGSKFPKGDQSVDQFQGCESFVARFNPDGTLAYGTYSGLPGSDQALDVARDSQGHIWVTGAFNTAGSDAPFVWELSADGSQQLYFSDLGLVGGSGAYGIAIDSQDNAWITGLIGPGGGSAIPPQAFLLKLSPDHHIIRFRSIGGAGYDAAFGIALDLQDNAYITGTTCSPSFPALVYNGTPAQQTYGGDCDAFIQKYTPSMDLEYSTFLGGRGEDVALAIAVTGDGVAYVTGYTTAYLVGPVCCIAATDFPTVATMQGFRPYADRVDPVNCPGGGCHFDNMVQAFVTKVNASGSQFLFSSFLGGDQGSLINVINPIAYFSARDYGQALTIDPQGKVWVTGETFSTDFPINGNPAFSSISAYGPQGFLAKIDDNDLPVIFIPGVSASELDRQDTGAESWLNIGGIHHEELALYPQRGNPQMVVPDVLRRVMAGPIQLFSLSRLTYSFFIQFMTGAGYREYDVARNPSRRTYAGCDLTQRTTNAPNFFVFAYDWRRPNAETAQLLRQYVRCVQEFYPGRKVNIVAHSMGAMVARRYILDFPNDHQVNALITVGGPLLGGPKLLYVLETGDFVDFIAKGTLKDMIASFTSAHEIIPAQSWLDLGGYYIVAEELYDLDGNGSGVDVFDYPRLIKLANQRYGSASFQPGTASKNFRMYQATKGSQDDWRNDQTGVKYFHIYGVKSVPDSIGQMVAGKETKCDDSLHCYDYLQIRTRLVRGDGTVPELSANRTSDQGNYNAANAVLVRCESPYSAYDENVEHTGLMSNPVVDVTIKELLQQANGGAAQPLPDPLNCGQQINTHRPEAAPGKQVVQPTTGDQRFDVQLSGAASLVISDTLGNSTLPISNTVMPGVVPGATDLSSSNTSHQLVLAGGGDYAVTFQTTDEPLAIDLTHSDSSGIVQATRFHDLVLPSGVAARLLVGPATPGDLAYDADGNGTFETPVAPTASASGVAAADVTPPTITFGAAEAAGKSADASAMVSVTVTAEDPDSGVRSLYYSLDGLNYQPVTGTVAVDPDATPVVYAFADDQVANRAPSRVFHVPNAGKPDLALIMSHPGPTPADGVLAYTLAISNTGASAAPATVTVTDSLPVSTTVVSAAGSGWTCTPGAENVVCTYPGPVAAGAALPDLALSVQATPGAMPAAVNEATVSTPGDWNPANNYALDEAPVQPLVDLALSIGHSPIFPVNGSGSYTLTVSNLGASPATGAITVTDSLPAGLAYSNFSGESWTCAASGQDVTCANTAPLAAGGTLPPLVLTVGIDASAYPSVTNTAIVSSTANADTNPANNTASDETQIATPADLSIYKSHVNGENPRPFQVGADDTYDIYVNNGGPSEATGPITVTDTLPAGLAYVSASGQDWSCSAAGQEVTCSHPGPLPAFNSLPGLQIVAHVADDAAPVVTNRATVAFAGFDSNLANNTWQDPTSITRYTDLGVTKSHSGNFVAGSTGVYTLHLTNYGPDDSRGGVEITDRLPDGMTLAGSSGTGWSCAAVPLGNSDYVTCDDAETLPVGASYPDLLLSVAVSANSAAQVTNTAYLSARYGFDQNGDNNSASDPTIITPAPPIPEADLAVAFASVSPDPAQSGAAITYRLAVSNAGPGTATHATLTNSLPAGVAFASAFPSAGACSTPPVGQTGEVVCDFGSLASGQGASVQLTGNVFAAPRTTITDTAHVASEQTDPSPANNAASRATAVAAIPCVSVSDGSWQNPGTWSCGRVPLASDDVDILHHVTLDAAGEITDVTLETGSELAVQGSFTLQVHGNWLDYGGSLTPGSGAMVFDKPGTATLGLPLTTGGMETFCNIQVGAATLLDTGDDAVATAPGCAATVNGAVSRSTPYALVDDATPASLADGVSRAAVAVMQAPGSNDLGMIGVTVVAHQAPPVSQCAGQAVPGTPILRTYDLHPLFQTDVRATVRLYYDPATESNGAQLGQLKIYHCDGAAWTQAPGPYTTGTEGGLAFVEAPGVTSFSPFALAAPGPLAVMLASFEAQAFSDHVLLTWETNNELSNRGFNLYRGTSAAGPDRQLNTQLIPSQSLGNPAGFIYTWEDRADLQAGTTYYYWVEDVDIHGAATRHGPVSAAFLTPTAVRVSGLSVGAMPGRGVSLPPLLPTLLLALAITVASARRRRSC